ncbi:MAG: thioredoxin family protein [Thiotrichales bacterium]
MTRRRQIFRTAWSPSMLLKSFALALAFLPAPSSSAARADTNSAWLPPLRDLATVAEEARMRGLPLLLVFSASHCKYCVLVEESFLIPMQRSGAYADKVIMRRVAIDTSAPVRGWNGRSLSLRELMDRYRIRVTPTVVLVDADGEPLGDNLVGISNEYFYGGLLDDAINQASQAARLAYPSNAPVEVHPHDTSGHH